jgi:hypothetical protein
MRMKGMSGRGWSDRIDSGDFNIPKIGETKGKSFKKRLWSGTEAVKENSRIRWNGGNGFGGRPAEMGSTAGNWQKTFEGRTATKTTERAGK